MLTSALRGLVNNPVKENFYEKKTINVLITFFISYKSYVKIFLKWCWGPFVEAQQTKEPNDEGHKELTG